MEILKDDKINFICLKDKCPKSRSCCESFKGIQTKLLSIYGHKFSDIPITEKNKKFIEKIGEKKQIFFDRRINLWFIKLKKDRSCPFHKNGLCEIYNSKPPVCTAYPFYFDLFAGLCIDKHCPGVGAGWTNKKKLKKELHALKKAYELYFSSLKI